MSRPAAAGALALAALVALVPSAAPAQQAVRVRAGEHPGFTRLVIDATPGQQIEWGIDGDRLLMLLDAPGLDTGPAARIRGLTRTAAIEAVPTTQGPALAVALTCPCGARVQRMNDGRIVVDIATDAPRPALPARVAALLSTPDANPAVEPPRTATTEAREQTPGSTTALASPAATPPSKPSAAPAEPARQALQMAPPPPRPDRPATAAAPVAPSETAAPQTPPGGPASPAPTAAEAPARPAPTAPPAPASPAPQPDSRTAAVVPQQPEPTGPAPPELKATDHQAAAHEAADDETTVTVETARKALLRQLEKAAEQGYLTLAHPPEAKEAPAEAGPDAGQAPTAEAGTEALAIPEGLPVRARTGSELAASRRPKAAETADGKPVPAHCMADEAFAVGRWTTDAPLDLQIGERRREMVGEFDAAETDAVLAYVRLLIAHGFGLEAQGALQAFAEDLPATPYLHDLARLVDGDGVGPETPVGAGLDCPGAHHVWAVAAAAMERRLDAAALDVEALRPTLADLPPRLRTRLVVPVATAALEAGRIEEAEVLAGMAARAEPPPPDGDGMLLVLLARIDAARGDWRRAEATLAPLIGHTSPAGIEAMIRMVEFRVARRAAPPRGMAENMEALAFTLGPSELGRRLLRAAATARAAGEGLGLALGALQRLAGEGGDAASAMAAARDMLVDYAPDPEGGAAYAEAVLTHEALLGDGPEADRARIAIAKNFMAIGLDNLAGRMLAPALARNVAGARLTAAEGATAAGDALRAIELLDGLDGERAARLRAAALFAVGDAQGAAAAAARTGDAAFAARYAWLAGDWAAAAAAGDADQRILAAWMAGGGEMPPELREAAAADPALAARMEAFSSDEAREPMSLLEAAGAALEQSRRRRAVMGEILGDG